MTLSMAPSSSTGSLLISKTSRARRDQPARPHHHQ